MAALFVLMGSSFLATYLFVSGAWERDIDRQLKRDFDTVGQFLSYGPAAAGILGHLYSDIMFVVTDGDNMVYHSSAMCHSSYYDEVDTVDPIRNEGLWRSSSGKEFALLTAPMTVRDHVFMATIAIEKGPMNQSLQSLASILVLALGVAMAGAALWGFWLATRALSPLGRMARKMQSITTERLSERLAVENPSDEMGKTAIVFNQTMDRLENSYKKLKNFTAEVSHELRTPLTVIRSVGELALRAESDCARYRDAIGSMLEEADRLSSLVDTMLTLARADTGQSQPCLAGVDICALARSVAELLLVLAEEKGQIISIEAPSAPIVCALDESTAKRALVNVLDNAIRYTPRGGTIRMILGRPSSGRASIDVVDEAKAIPKSEREALFERFHRTSGGEPGHGLGLAIVKWAMELNRGEVAFVDHEGPGNRCRLEFTAE
jgi:heavy metal sensor kinase